MDITRIKNEEGIDPHIEADYAILNKLEEVSEIHCHEYFEIFIVIKGCIIHAVNDKKQFLEEGALIFIRPDDIHYYEKYNNEDFQFINLAFGEAVIHSLFNFLGRDFMPERLLMSEIPPVSMISKAEKAVVKSRLDKLFTISLYKKADIRIELKSLLFNIFLQYFPASNEEDKTDAPDWLNQLFIEMQKKENFTCRLDSLQKLAGKSPEHICRMFKKHLDKTPTDFINELRLNYAANLLLHTDADIISISMESGYENLSHFYHCFKKLFNLTPLQFRRTNKKVRQQQ